MNRLMTKTIAIALAAFSSALTAAEPAAASSLPQEVVRMNTSLLSEEQATGVTGRPEWTGSRRFPGTRVYIQKEPGQIGIESWWRFKRHRDGTVSNRLLEEIEIGLPHRMQLDLYSDVEGDGRGAFHLQSFNIELRWALADWGQIWGNPTVYGEYKIADKHWGPDVYEFKLLLGDQLAPQWHWGVNFVWEAETGGEREQEFQVTGGLSYTVIDGKFGVGVEAFYDHVTVRGARGDAANIFAIGPSLQWRVTDRLHVDLNCMFGTNEDTDRHIAYLVVGYDFGSPEKAAQHGYTPISGQRN